MRFLEDQHGAQPNGLHAAATDVDAQLAHLLQQTA